MANLNSEKAIGGASSHPWRNSGSVSGMASSRAWEAGSSLRGGLCTPLAMSKQTKKIKKLKKITTNIRVATWDFGSLNKRNAEVVETLSMRQVDICGVQEHMFTGSLEPKQVRTLTNKDWKFKFFFCARTGIMLSENWADKVIEVQRISDRIILLKLITFLSAYAPQVGRTGPDKERFYDQLQCPVAKVPATEILIRVGDWNGHVGASDRVYSNDHGGHGFGNTEGEKILEFAIANGLCDGNTCFTRSDTYLIAYSCDGNSTQIDYIIYPRSFRSAVSNVKVIPKEECVKQHYMVACNFSAHIPHMKKHKFSPHIRTWKLRDHVTTSLFQSAFKVKRWLL